MKKLKIALDFRIEDPRQGLGMSTLTLLHGLIHLNSADQEYFLIVPEHMVEWAKPYVGGPCSLVVIPATRPTLRGRIRARLAAIGLLRRLWITSRGKVNLPHSDGIIERLGCDVVHFPSQIAYLTQVPSIYQPWDLQHRHLPQFFTKEDVILRETSYKAFCRQARFVCVQTEWGKRDLIEQFSLSEEKIAVIPWGTAFEVHPEPDQTEIQKIREVFALPERFLIFPAVAWPHKNHQLILQALAVLKQRSGLVIDVVFTGKPMETNLALEAMARKLGVQESVHFLGFVTHSQLQSLFFLATAMVFPSRFEGLGMPILEAFHAALPVLCSSATVLPEVSAGAALLFDPDSPEQLADAIERILSDPLLRMQLTQDGTRVLAGYSTDRMARQFVELYRNTAGQPQRSTDSADKSL